MDIGILGTGTVGRTIGTHLARAGHRVVMGSRRKGNEHAAAWAREGGPNASEGTFADAARFSEEVVFNCTAGTGSLEVLSMAGESNLGSKILVDIANPLDFSRGMPPTLAVCNTDSLGEQIQRAFPNARVVKALNTMSADVMVNPTLVPDDHTVFLCGNDAGARRRVGVILHEWFGWPQGSILDLGDITAARGTEMLLPIWLRLWATFGTPHFNFHIASGTPPKSAA